VHLDAGQTYYLVVDGYGADCGEYVLTAGCDNPPCTGAVCQPDAWQENEPPFEDGYVDTHNGGCDVSPPVFQALLMPADAQTLEFCGTTGWYESDGQQRDSDWFLVEAAGELIEIWAEGPLFSTTELDVLYLDDCENVSTLPYEMGICFDNLIQIPTTPGEIVYLRVRPNSPTRPLCAQMVAEYTLSITGISGVVATETRSWSEVKELYR
jgi:hypothetical protein